MYCFDKGDYFIFDWKNKLDKFLNEFEHTKDIDGVLVCGSYITGNPTNHSDLDVHIILESSVDYRQRGNKIVDGLLIEYFSNPPQQILKYFNEDLQEKDLMTQVQFATGQIIFDKSGKTSELKNKAKEMIDNFYKNEKIGMSDITKYGLWDRLDNLQDAFDNNKADFDFIYYIILNGIIEEYMKAIHRPYRSITIYGNITSDIVRQKYLLKELPNPIISDLIFKCIIAVTRDDKVKSVEKLYGMIIDMFGGFEVDGFKMKSKLDT